jgi:hypothetical protein
MIKYSLVREATTNLLARSNVKSRLGDFLALQQAIDFVLVFGEIV